MWAGCSVSDGAVDAAGGAGERFSLADVAIGLSVQRWFMTPMQRPELPAVAAYYQWLGQRPGFCEHGCNGLP